MKTVDLHAGSSLGIVPAQPVHVQRRAGSPIPTRFQRLIDIAPRYQWNENFGYCGETSFISAGMYFGQYSSQFTARALASPGIPQSQADSQLLLGVNDVAAAGQMRLAVEVYRNRASRSARGFLTWVKRNFLLGRVVVIGIYNNVRLLGEQGQGDPDYDHIVPVLQIGSKASLTTRGNRYFPKDVLTFSDNGLYTPGNPPRYPFLFSYRFASFLRSRAAANALGGPVYSLRDRPPHYGIAITGIVDRDGFTVPVRLTSNVNYEPPIGRNSNVPPAPIPITLTATVTLPDPGVAYNLYRYDDFAKVPIAGFNAHAVDAVQTWMIPANSGPSFVVTIPTMSDQTVVFRAVPTTAP